MGQQDAIAFLTSAAGHPGGGPVDVVETHGAIVFLAGDVALKIKREVKYDYMDLSTLERRQAVLRRELELNQPVAPKIYQDVLALTRAPDGTLALDGTGEPIEWVLRMWRFPAEAELAVIAETQGIDDSLAQDLGEAIHRFHARAPVAALAGARLINDILDELDRVFADMHDALGQDRIATFLGAARAAWRRLAPTLDLRGQDGHVRRCHGDLHLRNLVLLDGGPVPFDALEFDEVLGTCDVLYDLAFLLMDLHQRDLDRAGNIVLASYLLAAGGREDSGMTALPLFLAVRAAILAMVAVQTSTATQAAAGGKPARILDNAITFLRPTPPQLVLIGGLSGTGKTTVAHAVAPFVGATPGAVHLRTDQERKAALGLDETTQAGDAAYSEDRRAAVYERLFERAAALLSAGQSVLIDATFLDPTMREKAMTLGRRCHVPVQPVWLEAPLDTLVKRVSGRSGDASDAGEDVVRAQHATMNVPDDWVRVSATGTTDDTATRVLASLDASRHGPERVFGKN